MLIKEGKKEEKKEEKKQIEFIDFSNLDDEYIVNDKVYEVSLEDSTDLFTELHYCLYIDDVRDVNTKHDFKIQKLKSGLYFTQNSIIYKLEHIYRAGDYLIITFSAKNIDIIC